MNIHKRWSLIVSLTIVLLVGSVAAINMIVDANGILTTDFTRQFQPPNMSFTKIRFLLGHKNAFDSFLFGSSRENYVHVKDLTSPRYYNMFLAAGLPEEYLAHLRFLLQNGITVRNVMIGLDEYSDLFDAAQNSSELDLQSHPAISGKSLVTFYAEHLLKLNKLIPQVKSYVRFNYGRREESRFLYDIAESGNIYCRKCDDEVERDVQTHVRSDRFLRPWEYRFVEGDHLESTLSVMRQFADLAREKGFRLIVFINPIHRTTYLNTDLGRFARFKKGLADITDYYDFSGLNSITTNNYYYYETSHFRPLVGDMMLRVMEGGPAVSVPGDFGFHVTPENIDSHLKAQCREVMGSHGGPDRGRSSLAGEC